MDQVSYQVFICYAHPDMGFATSICASLEESGIRCWMAPRDISPSKDWAEEIIDAIGAASMMVLVFSSHANISPQVRREVERAVSKRVPILPLRVEDVPFSKSLEYFVSTPHWLDAYTPPFEAHLEELRVCVTAVLGTDRETRDTAAMPSRSSTVPEMAQPTASGASVTFGQHDLKYLETQLANYLGPVAQLLVAQGARKASSMEELVTLLARELSTDAERKSFQHNCRFLGE